VGNYIIFCFDIAELYCSVCACVYVCVCVCVCVCLWERERVSSRDGSWAKCLLAGEPVVDRWCLWEKLAPCRVSPQENAHANADRPTVHTHSLTHTHTHTHTCTVLVHTENRNTPSRGLWVDYNLFSLCCSQPVHSTARWVRPQREGQEQTVRRVGIFTITIPSDKTEKVLPLLFCLWEERYQVVTKKL